MFAILMGLSPHRRGNQLRDQNAELGRRSIPAQAGEPTWNRAGSRAVRVYPRTGGGTAERPAALRHQLGLSPHRRGNPLHVVVRVIGKGSIPAQAGEPWLACLGGRPAGVYPRTGGGTTQYARIADTHGGLSPHRRGNPLARAGKVAYSRSIPAQAGEPLSGRPRRIGRWVYPRTGGGTTLSGTPTVAGLGLSPHRRGNRYAPLAQVLAQGSIPAQAGEPTTWAIPGGRKRVYPRTGGGTRSSWVSSRSARGLSPHRRGNP